MNYNTRFNATVGFTSCRVKALISVGPLKRALLAATMAWAVVGADAQTGGTVNFGNHSSSLVTYAQTGLPVQAGDNVKAALYWAPLGSSTFTRLGAATTVGVPLPGVFVGGTRTSGAATPGGSNGLFQVRAWGGGYPTYELAFLHTGIFIGQSPVFTNPTGNSGGTPPSAPVSLLAGGFSGFALTINGGASGPPTITCASNKTVQCGSAWNFDVPTAADGCTLSNVPVYVLSTVITGQCPQLITRTWGATNSCDTQHAACSQMVTVLDTTPPVLTCASNKFVQCGTAWAFDTPMAIDTCSGSNVTVAVLSTTTNGVCPQMITRWWQAADACGNSNSCSQMVTVVDTTPPLLACASNKTVQCGMAWAFDTPMAIDACSGSNVTVAVLSTTTNGAWPLQITRWWRATDACGNSNSCSQMVTLSNTSVPLLICASNKTVNCTSNWAFDFPTALDPCTGTNLPIWIGDMVSTSLGPCTQLFTQTWTVPNSYDTNLATCSQTVTVTCSNCPVIAVTKQCPPNPVPPGGTLVFTGTVTNIGSVPLRNVLVFDDQPAPNTLVYGPATLLPGAGARFTASYRVPACSCGPFVDTLSASGISIYGGIATNYVTASCPGTNAYALAGDLNGDGIVDQDELNAVLANYWASSQWLYMTNPAMLGGGFFQFALTNATGWNFTVLASTNLVDWTSLPGPAYPVYQFHDPDAATNAPMRAYRLRWP